MSRRARRALPTPTPAAEGLSTTRIGALADGIFAIVLTLLIFNLQAPAAAASEADLQRQLWALWPAFVSHVISFAILGVFWFGHHMEFHYIRRADRVLLWLNLLHLLAMALIPFSASLLGRNGRYRTAAVIYGLNLFAGSLSRYWHWSYATHGHRLVDPAMRPSLIRRVKRVFLAVALFYLVAIGLAFWSVPASLILYALLPLLYIRPAREDRHLTSLPAEAEH